MSTPPKNSSFDDCRPWPLRQAASRPSQIARRTFGGTAKRVAKMGSILEASEKRDDLDRAIMTVSNEWTK